MLRGIETILDCTILLNRRFCFNFNINAPSRFSIKAAWLSPNVQVALKLVTPSIIRRLFEEVKVPTKKVKRR